MKLNVKITPPTSIVSTVILKSFVPVVPPNVCPSTTNTSPTSKLIPDVCIVTVYCPKVGLPLSILNVAPEPADS